MIIDTILEVAKELLGLGEHLKKAKKERREEVALFFEKVSTCLRDVMTSLMAETVPHGKCAEMETYARDLPGKVSDQLGKQKAEELGAKLWSAYAVEGLVAELHDRPSRDAELAKLDEAAGVFDALSNLVRV